MRSDFVLEVHVRSYNNPTHGAKSPIEGEVVCCDDENALPPNCRHPCDNRFIFCLREFGRNDSNLSSQSCPYGRNATDHYNNNDNLTFTIGEDFPGGVPNPVVFSGTNWPVSMTYNQVSAPLNAVKYLPGLKLLRWGRAESKVRGPR